MRKDILLSLLAAGAMPTAALANIDVTAQTGINDATKWQNNGLGSVDANGDLLNGGYIVVSGASAGSLSFDIDVKASKLPVGNYIINVKGDNIKLTINDKVTNEFTLTGAEETVTVKIQGTNPGGYSLVKLTLEIDCDFATLQTKLNNMTLTEGGAKITDALEEITANDYEAEGHKYAAGLKDAETALQKKIDAMKALIAKLNKENENLETYLDKDLGLWNEPTDLETKLKDLLAEIDAHNANVVEKNTKSANWGANQTEKAKLAGKLKDANDEVKALDLKDEFVAAQTKDALDAYNEFAGQFEALLAEYDIDSEDLTKNEGVNENVYGSDEVEGALKTLETLKQAVIDAQATAVKDAAAYEAIQGWVKDIVKEYNSGLNEFMGLHVGNQSATWTEELTAIKDAAVAKLEEIEKIGADANKAGAEATKYKAIQDLKAKVAAVKAAAQASDDAYAIQDTELKAIVADMENVKKDIDKLPGDDLLPNAKAELTEQYNEIMGALAAARTMIDGERDEYKSADSELNLAAVNVLIQNLKDELSQIQTKVAAWQTNEDAIKALEDALNAAQDALVAANGKLQGTLAGAGVDGVDLVKQFEKAYKGCVDAIDFSRTTNDNNLKNGKSDDIKLDYATTGVNEYFAKAAPTAEKFTAAVTAYSDLTAALNALKTQVNGAVILPGNGLKKDTYSIKWLSADKKSGYEVSIATILEGIKTAAGNKADAIYTAIAAVELNPGGVKKDIATDVATFAEALTTGNMAALNVKAGEYNKAIAGDAADVFGPGLDSVKDLMNSKDAVGEEGKEGYKPAVKGYTEKVSDKDKEVNAVPNTTYPVKDGPKNVTEGYQALDASIVELYNTMVREVGGLLTKCEKNVKAYAAYKDAYDNTIKDLEQWVKDNSNAPAQTNWLDEKNKNSGYGQIVADKKALDAAIEAAYKANNLTDASEKNKKDALSAAITNFKKAVTANEENHNDQLKYAAQAVIDVKDAIEAASNSSYSDDVTFKFTLGEEEKELTKAEIIELLKEKQKGLQALNKQVYDDYAALNSQEDNVYGGLVVEVQAIVNAMSSAYRQAVLDANWATANAAMDGQYDGLDEAYKAAVALYNRFTAEIAGKDDYNTYVGLLKEEIDAEHGHAELQKHYQTMRELQQRVAAIVNGSVPADLKETDPRKFNILDATAFDGVTGDVADAGQAMKDYNADLTAAVNTFASEYLKGKFSDANTFVEEQVDLMSTAQMPDEKIGEVIADAKTHIDLANAYLNTDPVEGEEVEEGFGVQENDWADVKSGDVEKYFINMPAALAELALIDIDTHTVLKNFWNDSYAAAQDSLAAYQARYDAAAPEALDVALEEPSQKLAAATGIINQLNVWAQNWLQGSPAGFVATLFGKGYSYTDFDEDGLPINVVIPGLVPELANALEMAKEAAEAAEQAQADNAYNIAKLAELQGVVGDIDTKIKEMHATIGALGLTTAEFAQIPTETADEEFEALKAYLLDEDGNPTKYAGRQEYAFNAQKGSVLDAIAAAYEEAEKVEKAYLQRLLTDIQADFNTKYEAGELENADELDALIAAQRDALADVNLGVELQKDEDGNEIELTPAERMAALKAIEEALFAIDLGTLTPNVDATGLVKEALAGQADGVDQAIKNLAAAVAELDGILDSEILAGWWHMPVAGADAEGMAEELAAIIAAYEADNSVETKGSYYKNLLNALLGKANTGLANVATAKAAAEKEIAKRELSNYWADAMDAEIAAVEAHYNTVLADMAEYKYDYYNAELYLSRIGGDLETDEDGNVIGGGLIAMAKYRVAQAREEFSLNNVNTRWNEKWEAMYDENGDFVENVLVDPQESVHTSLYNLTNIYSTVDNFALYAARAEVSGWRSEAEGEWNTAYYAVNNGHHLDQAGLNAELSRIIDAYYTISTIFTDVTEFSRNLMTAKTVIEDAKALAALAEANYFTPGDLDGNDKVTTNDFVTLIDIILGREEMPEEGTVEFAAADLNEDGEIGVGDAVKEMLIINRKGAVAAARIMAANQTMGENSINIADGSICLTNNVAAASVMLDLKGVSASDITLAARAQGMQLMTNTLADGTLRVVIISTDSDVLAGNDGAVLNVSGRVSITKAVMADANGREYVLAGSEATAIDTITGAVKSMGEKIYNVGGQLMNGIKRGLNIIRNADGSASKVVK